MRLDPWPAMMTGVEEGKELNWLGGSEFTEFAFDLGPPCLQQGTAENI